MSSRATFVAWVFSLAIFGVLMLGGCSRTATHGSITLQNVLDDMSPNFDTIALSREQAMVRRARAVDTNARQIKDDLDRVLFMYRPLRMSVYAIP